MKGIFKKAGLAVLMALTLVSFAFAAACSDNASNGKTSAVESLRLSETDITLELGEEHTLTAALMPEGAEATVAWSSENAEIASVSETGVVKAVKVGTTVITATAENASDFCQVTVVEKGATAEDDEMTQEGYLYYEDFTQRETVPNYFKKTISGTGAASVGEEGLRITQSGSGQSFLTYIFDEPLSGRVQVESRVKVGSTAFSNILFFYQGESGADTADAVVTLGMNGGGFVNHTGGAWHQICAHSLNTWYDIVMVMDIGNSEYELTLVDESGRESNYTLPFRNAGDGVEDRIKLLKLGTDKEGADITWQYIKIKELGTERAPQIRADRTTYSAVLSQTKQVVLDYDVIGEPEPTVRVASVSEGVTVAADNKTVSFTAAGTYTVTIEAENTLGKASQTFTVNVREDADTYLDTDFDANPGFTMSSSGAGSAQVSDGALNISTGSSSSSAFARYDFGATLTGNVLAEMVITDTSTGTGASSNFINLLFLYTTGTTSNDTSRCAFSLGIDDGVLAYHTGSGWKNETTAVVPQGRPVTISVLMNFEDAVYSVYMDGEPTALMNVGFRNPSLKDDVSVLYIGSDKLTSVVSYDSMKFVQVTPPSIEMEETASVDLDIDPNFALNYAVSPSDAQVSVICDKTSGWSWQDGKENEAVTFTAAGTYVFTVTAASSGGSVSKTITVTVTGSNLAPEIDVTSEDGNIVLQSADGYILSYNVTGSPAPEVVVSETTQIGGWAYDDAAGKITFTKTGYYEFIVVATNSVGTASGTFAVTVTDLFADTDSIVPFWSVTFGQEEKGGFEETSTEGGLVNWTDGGVNVALNGSGSAFVDKKFDTAFDGIVVTEITFTENVEGVGGAFTNLLFFYTSNSAGGLGSNAMGVAVRNEYNALIWSEKSSGGWTDFSDPNGVRADLKINTEYTLKVVNDFDNKVSYFYLSGEGTNYIFDETYLGSHVFRNMSLENIDRIRIGSDKAGTDFTVKSIVMRQFEETSAPAVPVVTVNEAQKSLTLSGGTAAYTLDYAVSPADAQVTITCDQAAGFAIDGNNVTFTAAGTYVFTVKAENASGSDSKTITVTVEAEVIIPAPEFTTAPEDVQALTLQASKIDSTNDASMIATQSASIVITYEVSDPEATVVLAETTDIGGWYFDQANGKIYFTRGGEYQFKLTATNAAGGKAEETFAVNVTDLYTKDVTADWNDFENWQFNTTEKPADWTEEELAGDGFRNWTANGLEMGRTSNNGSSFVHHQFEEPVEGVLEFTVEFTIDPESTSNFANIFFLVNGVNNGDSSVITVAVENNRLRVCENSGKWRSPAIMGHNGVYIVGGQKYTLRAIINTTTERVYLYIDGESLYEDDTRTETYALGGEAYLGNFDFRDNGNAINYYRMGSNNGTWVKFTVHSIVAKQLKQAPTFTTTQKDESLTLQTEVWNASAPTTSRPHVTLSYEISASPAAEMLLEETTEIGGWTYDAEEGMIYFTRGGSYEFKLTATNSEGSADCTFAVDVTDLYALENSADAPVIFEQQFNSTTKPEGWTETIGTPGTDSITYSENGVTIHKDTSGKSAFLQYDFEEALNGVVEFTLNFKTTDTTFANIFFLRGNDNNYAVTVAVQKNILIVREENSWSNSINLFNNTKTRLVPGVDYTLRAVVDCENERVYLYISGESLIADGEGGNAGENAAMGDNLYLGNFDFRANGQPVLAYRFGSDGNGGTTEFTVYSIVAKQLSPVVTVNQSSAAVDFANNTATYTLNYTVSEFGSPEAAVITCDQKTGWTNEGNVITFTQTGTYVFTVTAENAYGSGSGTITVTVKKPTTSVTIDVDSDRDAAVNAGGYYTLKYTAGSDVANVELTCDQQDGYSYDAETGLIHFTAPGVYNFTLTATDEGETLTDTSNFKVTVTDEENVIWNPTLTSEVSGPDITNKADGAENRGTITFDQNGMTVTSGAGVGGSAPLIFYKKFDSALNGLVKTEITFVDNNGTGFINLAFFHNSGITSNDGNEGTMVVAVENGALRHRGMVDGSLEGWTSFSMDGQLIKVQPGEEYTLTIYNDFDNEISYIYLTGTVVLGESTKELDNCYLGVSNFRRQGKGDAVEYFYTGTSQRNTSYTIKSLNIEQSFAPQIFMNSSYNVQEGGTLALNTLGAADGYIIDCAQEGWSIEGNVITFAQSGTYEMTVRAYSDQGESDAVSITANVAKYGAWLEENGEVVINTIAAMEQSDYANYGNGSVEEEVWTPWTNCTVTGMHNADNGTSWDTPEDAKANAPWLEFKVKIQTPGTYTMFVQLSSLTTVNNSIHCGHDGTPFQCSNPGSFYIGKWIYTDQYTFELTEGEHTISLYVREDGSAPNQIWLRNMGDDTTSTFDYRSGWVDGASKIESDREIIAE